MGLVELKKEGNMKIKITMEEAAKILSKHLEEKIPGMRVIDTKEPIYGGEDFEFMMEEKEEKKGDTIS